MLALAAVSAAHAATPPEFFGLYSEGPLSATGPGAFEPERAAGARVVRLPFDWARIEPAQRSFDDGPYDALVGAAARAGVRLLPVLISTPAWASSWRPRDTARGLYPPRLPEDMAAFAAHAVRRWGRGGSFWREHPDLPALPITAWQVWNEPNIPYFWPHGPDASQYVALLRATSAAIRSADPEAEVVTAGIPDSSLGIGMEPYVQAMYDAGAKGTFDTLAIHPYAHDAAAAVAVLWRARALMNANGDDAGLRATEFGWATGGSASYLTVGEQAQATSIAATLTELAGVRESLGLRGIVYYDWQDSKPDARDLWPAHAGLLRRDGTPKPGYFAFRDTIAALVDPGPDAGQAGTPSLPRVAHASLPQVRVRHRIALSRRWRFRAELRCSLTAADDCAAEVGLQLGGIRHRSGQVVARLASTRTCRLRTGERRQITFVVPQEVRKAVRRQGWIRLKVIARAGPIARASHRVTLRARRR